MEEITLKLTSAIAVDGEILKAGRLVQVTDSEAKNLLGRGKAVLATASEVDRAFPAAEAPKPAPPMNAEGLRLDGPTLAEFVKAGYPAENYPPHGYASLEPAAAAPAPIPAASPAVAEPAPAPAAAPAAAPAVDEIPTLGKPLAAAKEKRSSNKAGA